MYLIRTTKAVIDTDVSNRIDELAYQNGGKGFFNENDVFVANGGTRVFVNSLPELANIIEHFAFNFAKGTVESVDEELGESMYSEEAIEDQAAEDVRCMTVGKEREMWLAIRGRIIERRKNHSGEEKSVIPNLKHCNDSAMKAAGIRIQEADDLIKLMIDRDTFERSNYFACSNLEITMCAEIGDFIYENLTNADHERGLELLRIALAF